MIHFNLDKALRFSGGKMNLQVEIRAEEGSFITLYGKSGAGKTSVLRMLAGLMRPDAGQIAVGEEVWFDEERGIHLRPQKRSVGFLFQDYALFPNMTVKENLEFALLKDQPQAIIKELIELIELGELQDRRPETLSGGQQQRVALARALVQRPQLLLLDEPLSALDLDMREKLQRYLLKVHQEYGLTTILVSHDQQEIQRLSDQVYEVEQGRILRYGTPGIMFPSTRHIFKCEALVESIELLDGKQCCLTFRMTDGVLEWTFPSASVADIEVGDRVKLEMGLAQLTITL